MTVVDPIVVYLHDRRILDGDDRGVFTLEELAAGRVVAHRFRDLQRDVVSEGGAGREVYGGFLRVTDERTDRVAGNEVRRGHRIRRRITPGVVGGLRIRGFPRLRLGLFRQYGQASRDALLYAPQRHFHGRFEPLGRQQAFGNVVHRPELQGAHRRELVAFLRDDDDRGAFGLLAQLAQQFDAECLGVFRARAEGRRQHQCVAVPIRQAVRELPEIRDFHGGHGGIGAERLQMVAQPLGILRVTVDDQQSGRHTVALGHDLLL